MKKFLFLCAIFALGFTALHNTAKADNPQLIAATFYADWCGSCKVLEPQVEKARGKADLDNKNVLFVTFNHTNKMTSNQATLLASALGISDVYAENIGKTGYMLLVNSETKEVITKLTKENKADEITKAIQGNI